MLCRLYWQKVRVHTFLQPYRELQKEIHLLYLEKGAAAYKRYSKICILAMEYATLCGATVSKLTYLQEHGECLIEEKAVQKLRL